MDDAWPAAHTRTARGRRLALPRCWQWRTGGLESAATTLTQLATVAPFRYEGLVTSIFFLSFIFSLSLLFVNFRRREAALPSPSNPPIATGMPKMSQRVVFGVCGALVTAMLDSVCCAARLTRLQAVEQPAAGRAWSSCVRSVPPQRHRPRSCLRLRGGGDGDFQPPVQTPPPQMEDESPPGELPGAMPAPGFEKGFVDNGVPYAVQFAAMLHERRRMGHDIPQPTPANCADQEGVSFDANGNFQLGALSCNIFSFCGRCCTLVSQ